MGRELGVYAHCRGASIAKTLNPVAAKLVASQALGAAFVMEVPLLILTITDFSAGGGVNFNIESSSQTWGL